VTATKFDFDAVDDFAAMLTKVVGDVESLDVATRSTWWALRSRLADSVRSYPGGSQDGRGHPGLR